VTLEFSIPLTPPSVNSYVRHTKLGRHYQTPDAIAFKEAVAIFARGRSVEAEEFKVHIAVYLGRGSKGDVDNFAKLPIDGLVAAGVIHSDAAIRRLTLEKHRDWVNPRTEISIEPF
jgi:Holliday junction resolvase RusA-like endonuclease